MFTLEEKPWSATDTLPWPPDHLRPYIKMDGTQDWEIVDDSIPDNLRKEFEEWHDKYVDIVHKLTKQFQENFEKRRREAPYKKIWEERLEALWKHKPFEKMKRDYWNRYDVGIIQPKCEIEDMTLEELQEYVDILNESRKNWLDKVREQENTPGYLPDDFDEKNIARIRKKYSFDKNLTFHEIIDVLNKEVLEINEYLKKKESE